MKELRILSLGKFRFGAAAEPEPELTPSQKAFEDRLRQVHRGLNPTPKTPVAPSMPGLPAPAAPTKPVPRSKVLPPGPPAPTLSDFADAIRKRRAG